MRLVLVTNLLPKYKIEFLNHLAQMNANLEITVFADVGSDSLLNQYADNAKCHFRVIPNRLHNFGGVIFRSPIRRQLNRLNADKIVILGNPRELSLIGLMLYLRLKHREVYVHGMFHRVGRERVISRLYYRLAGRMARKCLTYGKRGASNLMQAGVAPQKVVSVGTAIDESRMIANASAVSRQNLLDFKAQHGLSEKKIVLQVVRLSRIKKPWLILDLAVLTSRRRDDVAFVLIGGGELSSEIERQIKERGLEDVVRYLGPIYDERMLSYWFLSADVFTVPTCVGLSGHHAFAYGLPVVTDDNLLEQASEFEILCHGVNARIYESSNLESYYQELTTILDNEDHARMLSENARRTVQDIYSLDALCTAYMKALTE